jgi:hypothetical protein
MVLCFPLISSVLNEVRLTQSFAFCVVLCLHLISPFLMVGGLLNCLLFVGWCVFPHNTTQKANDWVTHTSLRTGDIRGKHNTTQKVNDWITRTSIRTGDIRGKHNTRVTQSFTFCVVLCLLLISPVLNEVCVTQSFAFCVVLCLPLVSPVLNEVRVAQSFA